MKKREMNINNSIKRFFEPILDEKNISIKATISAILLSLVTIISIFLLKEITNSLSNGWDREILNLLFIFIFFIILYYIIYIITRNWVMVRPMFRKYLYKKNLKSYIQLDNNEYEKIGTGKLISMIDTGINSFVALITMFFVEILPSIIFIIFSFIFIGIINIYYMMFVMIIFIFILFVTYFLQKKARIHRINRRDSNIGISKRFVKILMSKYEILQNNKIDKELKFISNSLDYNILLNKKIQGYNVVTDILAKILIDFSKILIIIMFGVGIMNKTINFGEFVSLLSIIYILDQIFTKSISNYIDFTKSFVDVEKLWDLFDSTTKIKGYDKGKQFEYKKGDIEIKKINYGYSTNNLIFKDFNLKIKGGKITALVGSSGSGKSTLVKLISGYIKVTSGDIKVDNQNINELSLKSYYKSIGYLTQDPSVFDGTILDNLTYAISGNICNKEIDRIIKLSKCDFIYELPNGINTEIGERGVRLSGGQKQRLSIAKIFLKNPNIIILDEPTSALDSFSEEIITKAMHNLFKNRTVIIIVHRLQTVKHADEIIVLNKGKIVENGNHLELIKQKGVYKKMLDLQSGF